LTSAAESFVVALARASKRAGRYLRGMSRDDRDDVMATALLWCWENRATYDVGVALDDWLIGAVRDAVKKWRKGEAKHAGDLMEEMPVPDSTSKHAEVLEAVERVNAACTPQERQIATCQAEGMTRNEISKSLGVSKWAVDAARNRFRELRALVPDASEYRRVLRADNSGGGSEVSRQVDSGIDRDIERLEFAPPQGKECPPCWRCKWFEGFLPVSHRPVTMKIVEPAIRAAVSQTEARKIEIAERVRAGTWRDL
jgi:RNA polymerase sigma factor (sigma-70 family)